MSFYVNSWSSCMRSCLLLETWKMRLWSKRLLLCFRDMPAIMGTEHIPYCVRSLLLLVKAYTYIVLIKLVLQIVWVISIHLKWAPTVQQFLKAASFSWTKFTNNLKTPQSFVQNKMWNVRLVVTVSATWILGWAEITSLMDSEPALLFLIHIKCSHKPVSCCQS